MGSYWAATCRGWQDDSGVAGGNLGGGRAKLGQRGWEGIQTALGGLPPPPPPFASSAYTARQAQSRFGSS